MKSQETSLAIWLMFCCILALKAEVQVLQEGCMVQCQCDRINKVVQCEHLLSQIQSNQLLSSLPHDVKKLSVDGASFPIFYGPNEPLPQLQYLEIRNANITTVDHNAFANIPSLVELHLGNNNLKTFSSDNDKPFELPYLKVLDLHNNELSQLNEDTFRLMPSLTKLNISHNNLTRIPPTAFHMLDILERLDLSQNVLDYIHPYTFQNLTYLQSLNLHSNKFEFIHRYIFENLTALQEVDLQNNPWDCHCGLEWLAKLLATPNSQIKFHNISNILCEKPMKVSKAPIHKITETITDCDKPHLITEPMNNTIPRLHSGRLDCNASGYPSPSVYWITPHGYVLAHKSAFQHVSPTVMAIFQKKNFMQKRSRYLAELEPLKNGSLLIKAMRLSLAGQYVCVAENPAGLAMSAANVTISGTLKIVYFETLVVGFGTAMCALLLNIVFGSIRLCVYKYSKNKKEVEVEEKPMIVPDQQSSCASIKILDQYDKGSSGGGSESVSLSSADNYDSEEERSGSDVAINLKQSLDDARERLRTNMERHVGKIRNRAEQVKENSTKKIQNIKENSSLYMQTIRENIKESSSHYMHTLKSSTGQFGSKLRTGVVLGVSQVKYHVQSMKELCGTGYIGQTVSISTISVSTNVDSNETTSVQKTVTFV